MGKECKMGHGEPGSCPECAWIDRHICYKHGEPCCKDCGCEPPHEVKMSSDKNLAKLQDLGTAISAYEAGELSEAEEVELFQKLIDNGMAWKLQGHYGRNAEYLINIGRCTRPAR